VIGFVTAWVLMIWVVVVFARDMGYKKCKLRSPEDLWNPFVAMYFGAAYVCWLSTHQGRCNFLFLTLVLHSSINVCCESMICWVLYP